MHFWMCCILALTHACALFCIPVHIWGCVSMHSNAYECVRMRKNAHDCGTTHTYTREAGRIQGQTHTWTDTHECTVMRMNASECARMHLTVGPHILRMHTRVSMHESWSWASPPREVCTLPDCVCEWMHLNALECVRMRVRQNATCDRMHLMCGGIQMHLNATHVECNTPWMRLNA